MELRDYIADGVRKAGTVIKLAETIGVPPNNITDAKAHRRGLPNYALYKLAEYLGENVGHVIAASELVMEKDPKKRAIFAPFVQRTAATVLIAASVTGIAPTDSQTANNTNYTQ